VSLYLCRDLAIESASADVVGKLFAAVTGVGASQNRDPRKSPNTLCRKEYIELLMHLAKLEYPDLDYGRALQAMIARTDKGVGSLEAAVQFRQRYVWSKEVQELFFANQDLLRQVHR
jgi:hypothetical protein